MRYINTIDLGQAAIDLGWRSVPLEEFFEFYPFLGDKMPQVLARFHSLVQMEFEDARDSLILQIWNTPSPRDTDIEIVLDLDYFLVQPGNFDLNETAEWLETAHANVEGVFEGCLKDAARMLFR